MAIKVSREQVIGAKQKNYNIKFAVLQFIVRTSSTRINVLSCTMNVYFTNLGSSISLCMVIMNSLRPLPLSSQITSISMLLIFND